MRQSPFGDQPVDDPRTGAVDSNQQYTRTRLVPARLTARRDCAGHGNKRDGSEQRTKAISDEHSNS
jgi:hypothetical protein